MFRAALLRCCRCLLMMPALLAVDATAQELSYLSEGSEQVYLVGTAPFDPIDVLSLPEQADWVYQIASSSQFLVAGTLENRIRRFDRLSVSQIGLATVCDAPTAAVQLRGADVVYVACSLDSMVFAYFLPNYDLGVPIPTAVEPDALLLAPGLSRLYVSHTSGTRISIIDTSSNTLINEFDTDTAVTGMALSPDEKRAYFALPLRREVLVLDTTTLLEIDRYPVDGAPDGLDVSPDAHWLAVSLPEDDLVQVLDLDQAGVSDVDIEVPHTPSWPMFGDDSSYIVLTSRDMDLAIELDRSNGNLASSLDADGHDPVTRGRPLSRTLPAGIFKDGLEDNP